LLKRKTPDFHPPKHDASGQGVVTICEPHIVSRAAAIKRKPVRRDIADVADSFLRSLVGGVEKLAVTGEHIAAVPRTWRTGKAAYLQSYSRIW
jgi:hypothetical protein